MGKSSPRQPAAPDPQQTAAAQAAANQQTAQYQQALNAVDQNTPLGSLRYTRTPSVAWDEAGYLAANPDVAAELERTAGVQGAKFRSGQDHYLQTGQAERRGGVAEGYGQPDHWTATVELSPEQQKLLDMTQQGQQIYGEAALAQLGTVKDRLSTPFSANYSEIGDPSASRDAVEAALMERMRPAQERDRAALETRLANQGIGLGSQAWSSAMDDYQRQVNDARLGAVAQAGQEQSRIIGLRGNMLQQQLAERSQPLNEASALLKGDQVQAPQFQQTPQTAVANTNTLAGQQLNSQVAMNNFNQDNANYQANLAGQYGLANTFLQGSAYVAGQAGSKA